jgi:hypothetical protein
MIRFVLLFVAICSLSSLAVAEDKKPEGGMPAMDAKAMMEACKQMGATTPEHAEMAKRAGSWSVANKMWMDPKAPPMESKGSETCKMIMGGRVCQADYSGEMMGMPFHGMGLSGYDKIKKQYWSTWIDDMGTSIFVAWGTASADGKTITFMGKMDDPMTGKMNKDVKCVVKLGDDDHYIFEMWDEAGTPMEFKVMEMAYTRAK